MRNVARYIPAVIWLGLLTYGSLIPSESMRSELFTWVPYADKGIHFGAYFGSVFLLLFALGCRKSLLVHVVVVVVFVILWSIFLEYLQLSMRRGRSFEVLDIIANISGALTGAVAFISLFKRRYYGS